MTTDSAYYTETAMRGAVHDPNMYDAWTYDWTWHWAGYGSGYSEWQVSPQPTSGDEASVPPNILWVERPRPGKEGRETECSWWADQGDWLSDFPIDMTWLKFIDLYPNQALLTNPEPPPPFHAYSISRYKLPSDAQDKAENYTSLANEKHLLSKKPASDFHYSLSPDVQTGVVFYQDAVMNHAGEAVYANTTDNGGQPGRFRTGYSVMATSLGAHYFIGVLNE